MYIFLILNFQDNMYIFKILFLSRFVKKLVLKSTVLSKN